MLKQTLDAVETAISIHKGDFSSLRGKSFLICDNIKKRKRGIIVKKPEGKLTLAELAKKIDNLGSVLRNEMNTGFKQVNSRIDRIETRIDHIDTRLDYIVSVNNLKDLPKSNK